MKKYHLAACVLLGLSALSAHAQQNTVRFGGVHINVNSESPDFTSNGPAFLTPQPAGIWVGNANTLLLSYSRRLSDHVDIELAAGIPPKHKVYGRGTLEPYGVTAEVKQVAPTVFVNYQFFAPSEKFRPFVGVGLNFTRFTDATATASSNISTGGPTKIELSDSAGLAAQIGVSYKFSDQWSVSASIAAADVKSNLTVKTGSIERYTRIDFRPVVYSVSLGYSF